MDNGETVYANEGNTDATYTEDGQDPKTKKYMALYNARTVLSMIGTMEERRISKRQLKRMRKLGKGSV